MTMVEPTGNARVAAELAAAGFSVFPCHAGGEQAKRPMPSVFWRSASTTDRVKVEGWWSRWPDAAVALDLAKSGLLVIDADRHGDYDGVGAIAELWHRHGFDPDQCPLVATPNQGTHYYFRQPPGLQLGNGRGSLPAGVDVRGAGGYVIAPGTVMADGRHYEAFGNLVEAPIVPDWLRDLIAAQKGRDVAPAPIPTSLRPSDERIAAYVDAAVAEEIDLVRSAPRGQRNDQLNKSSFALGQLVGAGWIGEQEVRGLLENAALGLAKDDGPVAVQKTIRSGMTAGRQKPRQMPAGDSETVTAEDYAISANLRIGGAPVRRQLIQHEDGILTDEDGVVVEPLAVPPAASNINCPPGLVGEIAQWITATARRPQLAISVGAALATVGAAAGRQIAGPTNAGTALYILCLAPTSGGKDHPMKQARRIFAAAGLAHHLGPDEFMSMSAVNSTLKEQPLCFAPMDEFGDFMRRVYGKRSGSHERSIPKVLRSLWSTNFGPFTTPAWANQRSMQIAGAHLTLLGASTHQQFYGALEGGAASDGTLNRFLIIDVAARVPEQDPVFDPHIVPAPIIDALRGIYLRSGELPAATRNDPGADPASAGRVLTLAWANGAKEKYQAFGRDIERRMEQEPVNSDALSRASEMAIRIATIVAIGREANFVTDDDMDYAARLVTQSVDMMIAGANDYMAENETHANGQKVVRLLKARGGRAPYRDIMQAMRNLRGKELKELLETMCQAELIEKVDVQKGLVPQGGGHPVLWYGVKA